MASLQQSDFLAKKVYDTPNLKVSWETFMIQNKKYLLFIWLFLCNFTFLFATTRIMPLGDSITYDDTHADHRAGGRPSGLRTAYRNHLWYMLSDNNYSANFVGSVIAGEDFTPAFDPENEGHPGWTSYDIAEKTYAYMSQSKPDIVLLHIGTNDHSSNVSGVSDILNEIDTYEKNSAHPIRVYVALIIDRQMPDYKIVGFNTNLEEMLYQRMLKGDDLVLVDMYHDAHLTAADYIEYTHPNSSGYKKMARTWFNALTTEYTPKLHAYPYSLVHKAFIQTVQVDENRQKVVFSTHIPNNGILF